ncbi:hypothetical protein [Natronolimnohabitans innermongolicus]|uniref:hypothetical protein n=1 Tax=Natronolimnohabitans innermongolicus TaxID=253107 RepID=UPI001267DAF8|nr:hypothetical protein [Natronolimnohabitans innermongolicus]
MKNDRLDRVEAAILHYPDPVVTAPELATHDDLEDLERRQVLDELRLLERAGDVESKKVGANAVAWWHVDRVTPAPPRDPADHPDQCELEETVDVGGRRDRVDGAGHLEESDDELSAALEGWRPGRNREERRERREIGRAALEWLRSESGARTRSDFVNALFESTSLDGQQEKTWWVRVVRPALDHASESGFVNGSTRTYEWIGSEERGVNSSN